MSDFMQDNLPVADELAAMGFQIGDQGNKNYVPVETESLTSQIEGIISRKDTIEKYRDVHSLVLTEIQAKLLNALSDRKIQEASLRDLVGAYKTLKEKEHLIDGKPTEIKDLVGYLMELEKEEKQENEVLINPKDISSDEEDLEDGEK